MATNKIRVTPEKLKSTAFSLEESANSIQSLTQNMTATVTTVSGDVWSGEAQASYINKFNQLQQEVNDLVNLVKKHADHLNSIAAEYENAEAKNIAASNSLSNKVIN